MTRSKLIPKSLIPFFLGLVLFGAAACERAQTARQSLEVPAAKTVTQQANASGEATDTASAETCEHCANDECPHCEGAKKKGYHYSPFVLRVDDRDFETISFKDVGLGRKAPKPNDPLLEVLAESLAYELSTDADLKMTSYVEYDERILDPSNHVACGDKHLYVDVWRAEEDRWGYSLWSGCSEAENFEWSEVTADISAADALADQVQPLTRSIVESLAEAKLKSCFTKHC